MLPKILILLSTYNGERFLQEQLDSLKAQKDVELYYLIRDDGSHDSTISILQKFASENKNVDFRQGNNLGFAESFHTLMNWAYADYLNRVDYFSFCDQDDVWLPDKVSSAVSALQTEEVKNNIPLLYLSNAELVDRDLNSLGNGDPYPPDKVTPPNALWDLWVLGCTSCFNRKLLAHCVENTKAVIPSHDRWIALWAKFLGKLIYDPIPHILYRQHENNACGINEKPKSIYQRLKLIYKDRNLCSRHAFFFYESTQKLKYKYKESVRIVAAYYQNRFYAIKMLCLWRYYGFKNLRKKTDFNMKLKILLHLM